MPPSFAVLAKLLPLLENLDQNSETLVETIRVDPGLTADALRVANSATYAGAVRVESLSLAILRLGLSEIYRLTVEIISSPLLAELQHASFGRIDLWQHSLASGAAAEILARDKGENMEVAFTAGLLHDLGKVVLAQILGPEYIEALEQFKNDGVPAWRGEKNSFQIAHPEVAGRLLKRWNFPDSIVVAVSAHHDPRGAHPAHARLASIIYASNILAHRLGYGYGCAGSDHADLDQLELADIELDELLRYETEVRKRFEEELRRFQ